MNAPHKKINSWIIAILIMAIVPIVIAALFYGACLFALGGI